VKKYIYILFIITLLSCSNKNSKIQTEISPYEETEESYNEIINNEKTNIETIIKEERIITEEYNDMAEHMGENYTEEANELILTNDDILGYINENIFYGINNNLDYYINNKNYTIEYNYLEKEPEHGIVQDTEIVIVKDNYMDIVFANNMLISVTIYKNTNMHFLGRYIGEDLDVLRNILGKENWHQDKGYVYYRLNPTNEYSHNIQIITVSSYSTIIYQINFGISNILSSGLLPKTGV